MRGTMKITNSNNIYYLQRNWAAYEKASAKISAQQTVLNMEDNPMAANSGIRLITLTSRTQKYMSNIKVGKGMLGITDQSLASNKALLDKIYTLVEGAAQDSTTQEQRKANAIELNELLQQLLVAANGKDGERYLYGGQYTMAPPFSIVNGRYVNYLGDDKNIDIHTDFNTTQAINCTGAAAFGNMDTVISSGDMNPDISLSTDRSTRLEDLNGGSGIPKGKIMVYYSAYPEGLEVDLSGCDTLEDVKDAIEKQTLEASRNLNPADHRWLDNTNLNWRDLQDRYVKVTMNPEHNGISLQEFDLGEPLPEPNKYERLEKLDYTGAPGYPAGGLGYGVADPANGNVPGEELTVYDQLDSIYGGGVKYYAPLRIDDVASNKVAEGLGIKGTANKYDPANPDPILDGFLHGRDLNPRLSDRTLLADLEGYINSVYTFTNGAKPSEIVIQETTKDANNIFNSWNLSGLSEGKNTGPNGELYAKVTRRGAPDSDLYVELYTVPVDKAKPSDLVATGSYTASTNGGTINLEQANSSGLSGSVGIVLPSSTDEAHVSLAVDFGDRIQGSVYVPAFVEETNEDGTSRDRFNIASGWQIRGLDKPPAQGYDKNHPASTDLDGDVSVNYRYDDATNSFVVELYRPSFNDQPATLIASGSIFMGNGNIPHPTTSVVSGRVELVGAEGFEGVSGSVYIELPTGTAFAPAGQGTSAADATTVTYGLQADAPAGTLVLGGAMELAVDQDIGAPFMLKADTLFKAGQVFNNDIPLPNGGIIPAGTVLDKDYLVSKGVTIDVANLVAGTVLAEGQEINITNPIAAGTVIPRGTYYSTGQSFPAANMGVTVTDPTTEYGVPGDPDYRPATTVSCVPGGYDLRATFATIEDFNRAVEEAGVYVTSRVADDGKSLEFISTLAGAYLTISEDTEAYEQMNDTYQQLSGLDLNGLVKGVNTDNYGNVYTEVIYYPPDPQFPDRKVTLVADDGTLVEVDPGYYVRVYSDKDALNVKYENRDNSSMVAEGFLGPGEWNPAWLAANATPGSLPVGIDPFLPTPPSNTIGAMTGLVLEERNDSGVSGMVDLDYYGTQQPVQYEVRQKLNKDGVMEDYIEFDPWKNDDITIFPGGLRPEGSRHTTIQQWDMVSITPGVTCDYSGTYHGSITADASTAAGIDVRLHRDVSHSTVTARNDPTEPLGPGNVVQLYETNPDGSFVRVNGAYVPAGTMVVDFANLPDGVSDKFTLTTGAARQYGQEREENVFSTINDILDALNSNDAGKLHDLIEDITKDISRILEAAGDVAARSARMDIILERQSADLLSFSSSLTQTIGMDSDALSAALLEQYGAKNAYEAAMTVAGNIMQMSLLDYLR